MENVVKELGTCLMQNSQYFLFTVEGFPYHQRDKLFYLQALCETK